VLVKHAIDTREHSTIVSTHAGARKVASVCASSLSAVELDPFVRVVGVDEG
jgi:hypothetical protein